MKLLQVDTLLIVFHAFLPLLKFQLTGDNDSG